MPATATRGASLIEKCIIKRVRELARLLCYERHYLTVLRGHARLPVHRISLNAEQYQWVLGAEPYVAGRSHKGCTSRTLVIPSSSEKKEHRRRYANTIFSSRAAVVSLP